MMMIMTANMYWKALIMTYINLSILHALPNFVFLTTWCHNAETKSLNTDQNHSASNW